MFFLGLSSGFPFYIVKDVLKAQMTDAGIDIGTIGLFSAVSIPYTLKFLYSPLMDFYIPPFLGRRRGWMLITQILLLLSTASMGLANPELSLYLLGFTALVTAFFGASQDIVLDAFRREFLKDNELGFGTGIWMNAWRLGMFVAVGGAFWASDRGISYQTIYVMLSFLMLIGIITTLLVPEPKIELPPSMQGAASLLTPFKEFFKRRWAGSILLFILLYKLGDSMAQVMNIPFILGQGYSKTEYLFAVKGLGMFGLFGGVLVGGGVMVRLGIHKSLWIFGFLQAASTASFALIVLFDKNALSWVSLRIPLLSCIVFFEFISAGMGQAAYASYMAIQTNKAFTATQYSLLTSLMAVSATIGGAATGYLQKVLGWGGFYIFCAFLAVPGMALLIRLAPWNDQKQTSIA